MTETVLTLRQSSHLDYISPGRVSTPLCRKSLQFTEAILLGLVIIVSVVVLGRTVKRNPIIVTSAFNQLK